MKKILYESNKNVISQALRLRRVLLRLSQTQLAARMQTLGVNIDHQMISRIERNERFVTDYELACFCTALSTDPNTLLGEFLNTKK